MIGQTVGHYQILEKLGEGGMGIVYKAQDTKLDRTVALKFLPDRVTKDDAAKARFLQEAKAAAGLNHANICTVYGVDEHDGQLFMSMEYVEGGTLRDSITKGQLTISTCIDLGIQIGEALQEAHGKNIVHRDVKADNIMLTSRGQAKVMDFGLAKLKGAMKLTRTSSTVGTLGYMAPEQIQGGEVDHRSDIFSFGVLFFEMLTGKLPFRGEHEAAMVYSIVNEEPENLQRFLPNAAPELQYVISTALEKNPEDRYQQVSDVVRDLRRLKKQTSRVSTATGSYKVSQSAPDDNLSAPGRPSEAAAAVSVKRRGWLIVGGTVAAILLAISAYFLLPEEADVPFQRSQFTRITSSGKVVEAAFSPDGRYICYTEHDAGKSSMWVRQMATSSNIQIVPPANVSLSRLTFSPNGDFIYFVKVPENSVVTELHRIPVLGGSSVRILTDLNSRISFSPDGKMIAFLRIVANTGDFAIVLANTDGSNERTLAAHKTELWFAGAPSWSPDGKTIASGLGGWAGGFHTKLVAVDIESGSERQLTEKDWLALSSVHWNSDGTGLFVHGSERGSIRQQVYYITYPQGAVYRVTNDVNNYTSVSTTSDGRRICVTQLDLNFKLSFIPDGLEKRSVVITAQREDGIGGIAVAADARIYYVAMQGGNYDIFSIGSDGSDLRQLTSDAAIEGGLSVTPDGRNVLYSAFDANSTPSIWNLPIAGGAAQRLTTGSEEYDPVMDPTGRWIVMESWFLGPLKVMKIPAGGGDRIDLSEISGRDPLLSEDGRTVFFAHRGDQSPVTSVYSVPLDGGPATKRFDLPRQYSGDVLRRRPGTSQLSFEVYKDGAENIWVISPDGSGARQYTDFTKDFIANFAWMPNGKDLVVSRGTMSTDVVVITDESK